MTEQIPKYMGYPIECDLNIGSQEKTSFSELARAFSGITAHRLDYKFWHVHDGETRLLSEIRIAVQLPDGAIQDNFSYEVDGSCLFLSVWIPPSETNGQAIYLSDDEKITGTVFKTVLNFNERLDPSTIVVAFKRDGSLHVIIPNTARGLMQSALEGHEQSLGFGAFGDYPDLSIKN